MERIIERIIEWLAKKIIYPCKNCIVQPICCKNFVGDYRHSEKHNKCKSYQKYVSRGYKISTFIGNVYMVINWAFYISMITLIFLWIVFVVVVIYNS